MEMETGNRKSEMEMEWKMKNFNHWCKVYIAQKDWLVGHVPLKNVPFFLNKANARVLFFRKHAHLFRP